MAAPAPSTARVFDSDVPAAAGQTPAATPSQAARNCARCARYLRHPKVGEGVPDARDIDDPACVMPNPHPGAAVSWKEFNPMGEAKVGPEFIKHELDEAIAIQRTIVDAESQLSASHPVPESKRLIERFLKQDEKFLQKLEQLGQEHGATGKVEEVAGSLQELMQTTIQTAAEAPSEAYEAHAVLLNLKRKQQDSAAAMLKIAREMKDTEMRDAAAEFQKGTKESANELADQLAGLAVQIATESGAAARA
jgi:hypothetical protein